MFEPIIDAIIEAVAQRVFEKIQPALTHHEKVKEPISPSVSKPLSTKEAAEFLGINPKTLYVKLHERHTQLSEKKIPCHKKNNRWYFLPDELLNWIKEDDN